MSYIGTKNINKLAWNNTNYTKGYIGNKLLFSGRIPPTPTEVNYTLLYYLGDECTDITGGWETCYLTSGGVATKNKDNLYNTITSGSSVRHSSFTTYNKIDLTAYKTLVGLCSISNPRSWSCYRLATAVLKYTAQDFGIVSNVQYNARDSDPWKISNISPKGYFYADISSANKEEYIKLGVQQNTSNGGVSNTYVVALAKEDDLTNLISKCGLTNTTALTILASSSDVSKILSSEENVREMLKLTGDFMFNAMYYYNNVFLNAYKNSQYKSLIDSNEHWGKFITLI